MERMPLDWFLELPPVTRTWVFGVAVVTIAEQFHFVDEFQLPYSYSQAVGQREYWRFLTCFLYFGKLSITLCVNIFSLVNFPRMLEESFAMKSVPFPFEDDNTEEETDRRGHKQVLFQRNGPMEFVNKHYAILEYLWMLFLIGSSLLVVTTYMPILGFLGSMLINSLVYIWSRRNPDLNIFMLGIFEVRAPYFPWMMLLSSVVMSASTSQLWTEMIAIGVGHVYLFLEDIYPQLHNGTRVLAPPWYWIAKSLTTKRKEEMDMKDGDRLDGGRRVGG